MPTISVVIPAYNNERYLGATLDSVLAQDHRDIDVIVIDDGSQDSTCDIGSSYGDPVRVIRQKNSGVCAARNRGIQESRGSYVALLDHDDYWYPNKLSSQLKYLTEIHDVGVAFGEYRSWTPDATGAFPAPENFAEESRDTGLDPRFSGWIYHRMLLDSWILTSTAVARREVYDRCGGFNLSLPYSEDWEFWIRVSREFKFCKLKQLTTLYRQHPTQGSRLMRERDYATELLERASTLWGLASPDGSTLDWATFNRNLAKWHAGHGYRHYHRGSRRVARRSFYKAWRLDPTSPRYLAYLVASLVSGGRIDAKK